METQVERPEQGEDVHQDEQNHGWHDECHLQLVVAHPARRFKRTVGLHISSEGRKDLDGRVEGWKDGTLPIFQSSNLPIFQSLLVVVAGVLKDFLVLLCDSVECLFWRLNLGDRFIPIRLASV